MAGRGELKLEHQTSTFPMFLSNFMAHKCVHAECASADVCLEKPISCFWKIKSYVNYWPLGNHLPCGRVLSPLIFFTNCR